MMRYGDLTYEQIRDCASRGWLAIVPTGCTEQQGPHLPVDFGTWFAENPCVAGAKLCEAVVSAVASIFRAVGE